MHACTRARPLTFLRRSLEFASRQAVKPAIHEYIPEEDRPWYENLFSNDGYRVVEAQRRLTSYTDPFVGWVEIAGSTHVVRQRSPWKASFDMGRIESSEFLSTVREIGTVTATSHVRGGVGKAPVMFKEVSRALARSAEPESGAAAQCRHLHAVLRVCFR